MQYSDKDKRIGKLQLLLVIAFVVGGFAFSSLLKITSGDYSRDGVDDRTLFVETSLVAPGPYQITFEATGNVDARTNISVVPEVSGRIIKVHDQFFDGGRFNEGEVMFTIDPRDFRLEVQRLDAEVARAKTALEIEEAESAAALAEWAQINPNKKAPSLVAREPQLAEARANVSAARAQLANAKLDLERTRFTLPFDGRVITSDIALGQFVQAGQAYGTVFDANSLEVTASLEDNKLKWLLEADDPSITITSTYLGETNRFDGYLKRGAANLDAGTRFATVRFGLRDAGTELVPGVFTAITVAGSERGNITRVPASALQTDGNIWFVNSDETLSAIAPDILYAGSDHVAVRNIEDPTRVVTSRVSGVTEGMAIRRDGTANAAAPNNEDPA